jgi:hypothetical protein
MILAQGTPYQNFGMPMIFFVLDYKEEMVIIKYEK